MLSVQIVCASVMDYALWFFLGISADVDCFVSCLGRNVQGLIKVVGKLLQIQASQRDNGESFTCPYSIR